MNEYIKHNSIDSSTQDEQPLSVPGVDYIQASRINVLVREKTRTGSLFNQVLENSLGEYAQEAVREISVDHELIQRDRQIVEDSIRFLLQGRYADQEIEEIVKQYRKRPVIQTANHAQLLYDPATFLYNFVHQIGARQLGDKFLLNQQCSTVRMIQNRTVGPAFIETSGQIYKVFDKSNKKLRNSNVSTLRDATFIFHPLVANSRDDLPRILQLLRGGEFSNAASAITFANEAIWRNIHFDNKLKLVLFDEALPSEIIARMILTPGHPMRYILFDSESRKIFLDEIHKFIRSENALLLRDSTDFFFGNRDEDLVGVRLSEDGKMLSGGSTKKPFFLPYNPESVVIALQEGVLYPNLITDMLAISIFPGTTVIGGASQYEYVPEVQLILKTTLQRIGGYPDSYISSLTSNNLSTNISSLISTDHPFFDAVRTMDFGSNMSKWEDELKSQPLRLTMGDLSGLEYFDILFERRRTRLKAN